MEEEDGGGGRGWRRRQQTSVDVHVHEVLESLLTQVTFKVSHNGVLRMPKCVLFVYIVHRAELRSDYYWFIIL